jgi:hypothetical protein
VNISDAYQDPRFDAEVRGILWLLSWGFIVTMLMVCWLKQKRTSYRLTATPEFTGSSSAYLISDLLFSIA